MVALRRSLAEPPGEWESIDNARRVMCCEAYLSHLAMRKAVRLVCGSSALAKVAAS